MIPIQTQRARVCPTCGKLNGPGELRCYSCGKAMVGPSAWVDAAFRRPAIACQIILALCALDFVIMSVSGGLQNVSLFGGPIQLAALVQAGGIIGGLLAEEPWRYLSAVYVHLGLLHVGMNMFALLQLGRPAEQFLGAARFFVLYTVTGIVGFVASRFWYGPVSPATAGASGALFGLMGLLIGTLQARKDPQAKSLMLQQLAYAVAFALMLPVNNAAHLGGFVTGWAFGRLFYLEKSPQKNERAFRVAALICVALTIASLGLSFTSPIVAQARIIERLHGD